VQAGGHTKLGITQPYGHLYTTVHPDNYVVINDTWSHHWHHYDF